MNESQIFANALDLATPAERAAYLDTACAGNLALRAAVEALLRAHATDPGFLEQPAAPFPETAELTTGTGSGDLLPSWSAAAEQPGAVLAGRYKLIEEIGEGGMGTVWMAEQTEPVKRLVAVKLIKAGMDSKAVLARFEAERQALAMMDHPNIAKVLDAGATADGRPFFVMELVKGVPITKFCDERKLTPRERLGLFVPVCHAIQHAHQKGIIHRDIKPNNVLIALYDDRPVVKVIDFGVAKATGPQLTERTLHTGFGSVVGTPEYMSPEQASFNNLDIDTRSDVYALGVLLYELLAGSPPFSRVELEKAGLLEILRVIREQEPPRPSTRLSTADALPSLAANRGTEPARLTRLLRGDLDWIVMKALEKDRARRYETANGLAADVQHYLADEPVLACAPSAGYRLRKFVARNRGPVLAACVALAALVVGAVGATVGLVRAENARQAEAGHRAAAEEQRREAVAAKDRAEDEKRRADAQAAVARAVSEFLAEDLLPQADVAVQADRGDPVVADLTLQVALDRAAARIDGRFRDQPLVEAGVRHTVGMAYLAYQNNKAVGHLERALALREAALGPAEPLSLRTGYALGIAYRFALRLNDAVGVLERVVARSRSAGDPDLPFALLAAGELGGAYLYAGRAADAIPLIEAAARRARDRYGPDSDHTLGVERVLALCYQSVGRGAQALPLLLRSLDHARKTLGLTHRTTLTAEGNVGILLHRLGSHADAEPHLVRAFEGRLKVMGERHTWTWASATELAYLYLDTGRLDKAEELAARAVRACLAADVPADHHGARKVVACLAEVYQRRGKLTELRLLLDEDGERLRRAAGPGRPGGRPDPPAETAPPPRPVRP